MNDFKRRIVQETENKKDRQNKAIELITSFYDKEKVTEEEKQKILKMQEEDLPNKGIFHILLYMAKEQIEGRLDGATFEKCMAIKSRKIELKDQVPEKFTKSPEKWEEKEENKNER